MIATANLMEMKELATRQKLRELKEAMAAGKPFVPILSQNGNMNGHMDFQAGSSQNKPEEKSVKVNGDKSFNEGDESVQNTSAVSNSKVPNDDFYAKKKSEKDPTSKWESNYSRPTTPSNLTFQNDGSKSNQGDLNESRVSFDVPEKDENQGDQKHKKSQILTEEDMLEIQSRRFEKEINSRSRKAKERENDQRTYMPSEYVNGMSNKDQFDARKMNLSAKNFDSALSSMLGQENAKLIPDNTEYEQYARTSKYHPNPYLEAQRSNRPRTRSQRGQRPSRERHRDKDTGSAEGPRAEREPVVRKYKLMV